MKEIALLYEIPLVLRIEIVISFSLYGTSKLAKFNVSVLSAGNTFKKKIITEGMYWYNYAMKETKRKPCFNKDFSTSVLAILAAKYLTAFKSN